MTKRDKPAVWAAFIWVAGQHHGAWRIPDSPGGDTTSYETYRRSAIAAEKAKFEIFFLGDRNDNWQLPPELLARTARGPRLEPVTLISALTRDTSQIGLIATVSTTFSQPYTLARQIGAIDFISGGRAGWNVVTGYHDQQARNFGLDKMPTRAERYGAAQEYLDAVKGLWDSFDTDAMIKDRENGVYFDHTKMHELNFEGEHYKVAGPLNMPRPPQGYPVIAQAGASADGMPFAYRNGEIIFSISSNIDSAKKFYDEIKAGALASGRDVDDIRVLASLNFVIGATQEEADAKYEQMQSYLDVDVARHMAEDYLGFSLEGYDLDELVPEMEAQDSANMPRAHADYMLTKARHDGLTWRQLISGFNGVNIEPKSAEAAADEFQRWYEAEACDGFIIQFPNIPEGVEEFAELVVPILRERGLIREEYVGTTLREHLGLKFPKSIHEK